MKLTVKKVGKSFTNYWEIECISSVWLWQPGRTQGCLASPQSSLFQPRGLSLWVSMTTPTGLRPHLLRLLSSLVKRKGSPRNPHPDAGAVSACPVLLVLLALFKPVTTQSPKSQTTLYLPQALSCPLFFLLSLTPKSEILSTRTANSWVLILCLLNPHCHIPKVLCEDTVSCSYFFHSWNVQSGFSPRLSLD